MTYVYILQSEDGLHFYVGAAEELRGRLARHAGSQGTMRARSLTLPGMHPGA